MNRHARYEIRRNADGSVDEIVAGNPARGIHVHLEQMDLDDWSLLVQLGREARPLNVSLSRRGRAVVCTVVEEPRTREIARALAPAPPGWIKYVLHMTPIGGIGHFSIGPTRDGPWSGLSDMAGDAEPQARRLYARADALMKRKRYAERATVTAGPVRRR